MKGSAKDFGHQSTDAFMLFRYEGPGGRREWIWNSRDGITPFCIQSADEKAEMRHANWHLDQYAPWYIPPVGSRIFVDLTEEMARPLAERYVEKAWDTPQFPMSRRFETMDQAIQMMVKQWVSDWGGHSPHVVVVTEVMHEQFKARAQARGNL